MMVWSWGSHLHDGRNRSGREDGWGMHHLHAMLVIKMKSQNICWVPRTRWILTSSQWWISWFGNGISILWVAGLGKWQYTGLGFQPSGWHCFRSPKFNMCRTVWLWSCGGISVPFLQVSWDTELQGQGHNMDQQQGSYQMNESNAEEECKKMLSMSWCWHSSIHIGSNQRDGS